MGFDGLEDRVYTVVSTRACTTFAVSIKNAIFIKQWKIGVAGLILSQCKECQYIFVLARVST